MNVRETQLFVDDHIIESYTRVHRTIHTPQKFGPEPILVADRPWEGNCIVLGTVLRHPETGYLQIWYQTFMKVPPPENTYVCYATSEDGIHWDKPVVGDIEYRGSRENNIVLGLRSFDRVLDSPSVIYDPGDANEGRRYKMLVYRKTLDGQGGLFAAFSPDGVHWKAIDKPVAPMVGDRTNLMFDPTLDKPYVAYTRRHTMMADLKRRVVYRSESSDFMEWSDPELVLAPDLADSHDLQFYSMSAFRYGSMYLGFVQCLHSSEDRIDIQLATSRDNRTWQRTAPREVFLENGVKGVWDAEWVSIASNAPFSKDEHGRLWLYYEGRNAAHGQVYPFPRGSIGLATIRRDGFASIDAGSVEGSLTTKPFIWPGAKLLVNMNARGCASITDGWQQGPGARLEILDANGNVVSELSRNECIPFTGDSRDHDHKFRWTSGKDLNGLIGVKIRLRFFLVDTELYGFRSATSDSGNL